MIYIIYRGRKKRVMIVKIWMVLLCFFLSILMFCLILYWRVFVCCCSCFNIWIWFLRFCSCILRCLFLNLKREICVFRIVYFVVVLCSDVGFSIFFKVVKWCFCVVSRRWRVVRFFFREEILRNCCCLGLCLFWKWSLFVKCWKYFVVLSFKLVFLIKVFFCILLIIYVSRNFVLIDVVIRWLVLCWVVLRMNIFFLVILRFFWIFLLMVLVCLFRDFRYFKNIWELGLFVVVWLIYVRFFVWKIILFISFLKVWIKLLRRCGWRLVI